MKNLTDLWGAALRLFQGLGRRVMFDMTRTFDETAWVFDPDAPNSNVERIRSELIVVPVLGLTSQVRLTVEDFKAFAQDRVEVWSSSDPVPAWTRNFDHRLLQHCRETGHRVAARLGQIVEHAESVSVLIVPIPGVAVFYADLLHAFAGPINTLGLSVRVVPILVTTRLPSDKQSCRGIKFHLGRPTAAERQASVLGILDILERGVLPMGGTNYLSCLDEEGNPVFDQHGMVEEDPHHEASFA